MVKRDGLKWALAMAAALALEAPANAALAADPPASAIRVVAFDVSPQALADALPLFGRQAGVQITADAALVGNIRTSGVKGEMSLQDALGRLLAGTGLSWRFAGSGIVVLEKLAAADGAMTLDPVSVEGAKIARDSAADPLRTEGTRAYTAPAATVGKAAAAVKEIPQSVSVVTRQAMDDRNVTDLAQAMKNTTGMTVLRYDGAGQFNDIKSRGYSVEAIQADGVAYSSGTNFSTSFDTAVYDRIEVLRGPTGLYQSGGEPGGTINLARKRAPDKWRFAGLASVGSWDAYRGEADVGGPLTESGRLRGRAVMVVDDRGSYVNEVHSAKLVGYGTLEADLTPDTTLSFGLTRQRVDSVIDQGLTGYADGRLLDVDRSTFFGANWNDLDTRAEEEFAELQHRLEGGGTAQVSLRHLYRGMEYRGLRANGAVNVATGNLNYHTVVSELDRDEWSTDAHLSTPVRLGGLEHNLLAGVDYRTQSNETSYGYGPTGSFNIFSLNNNAFADPKIAITNRTRDVTDQWGAYGQARVKAGVDWLTLVGGGRLSWWSIVTDDLMTGKTTSRYSSHGTFTPYAGIVADVTGEVAVYASYSEIFKPQSQQDVSGQILAPRVGGAYEVGVKGGFLEDRLTTHLAVYRMIDENRSVAIAGCTGNACYTAAGKVRSQGLEAQVTGRPLPQWDVSAGYAYVETKTLNGTDAGNTFAPETPKHTASVWAKYSFPEGVMEGLSLGGGVKGVSSFYSQSSGIRWTQDAYAVVDALIGYKLSDNFDLSLNVNNLLDEKYYEKLSSGRQFYYGEPRSVVASLRTSW